MNTVADKTDNDIIDVLNQYDYSTQSDEYNKNFIEWRKSKDNPYTYNLVMNKKEQVFVDGEGFVKKSPSAAESKVLNNILYIIGIVLITMAAIDNLIGKIAVQALSGLGINIHNSFINSTIYGGCVEIVIFLVCLTLLKILTPLIITNIQFRMPAKLKFHNKLTDPYELVGAIATTLFVSAVLSIPSVFTNDSKEIYYFFKGYNADVSVWGQSEFLVYTIFDIIIVSVLAEALFRGAMFTALRQFGDVYAVLITSVVSGVIAQNLSEIPGAFIISAVSAIGMLRSGTIFTAITVRIIYKMYLLAISIIEVDTSDNMFLTRNFFIVAVFLVGVLIFSMIYPKNKRYLRKVFASGKTYLSFGKKLYAACTTTPLVFGVIICMISAIITEFI